MNKLASRGHQVLFVDPPIRTRKEIKQIFQGRWSPQRLVTKTYKPKDNLTVFTPTSSLPFIKRINTLKDQKLKTKMQKSILWIYHVEIENLEEIVEAVPHDLLIYDCVDDYPSFPRYETKEQKDWIIKREEWLTKKADVVFASATSLYDKLKKINKNTHFIPNAADYDMFAPAVNKGLEEPGDLKDISRPIIGFTGAIDEYKLNISLIEKAAKHYQDYSFVLIGPTKVADDHTDLKNLKKLSNVYFLGGKEHRDTPSYFSHFDVYTIPYNVSEHTANVYPVKFHEGLAAGLPTVVTNLPSYKEFEKVAYVAKSGDEYIELLKTAIEDNDDKKVRQRQKVASKNTYDHKVDKQLAIIKKHLS